MAVVKTEVTWGKLTEVHPRAIPISKSSLILFNEIKEYYSSIISSTKNVFRKSISSDGATDLEATVIIKILI